MKKDRSKKLPPRELETTKAGAEIVKKVRFIADFRDETQATTWDRVAGAAVDAEFEDCVAELKAKDKSQKE